MYSISLTCDIFTTLNEEIVTRPPCILERLLFVRNLSSIEV